MLTDLGLRNRAQDGVLGCGHCHRDPGAGDDQRRDQGGVGEVGRGKQGDPSHPNGLQNEPENDERPLSHPVHEGAGDRCEHE